MGNISRRVEQLEDARDFDYVELANGGYYWYEEKELYKSFFCFYMSCLSADYGGKDRPPVPDVFVAISRAKDRAGAMSKVLPGWQRWREDHSLKVCLDLDRLVEDGEIVPFNWAKLIMESGEEDEDESYSGLQ